jgi:hypothetical protein
MSILSRVTEGAELLDEARPRWDRNIDVVHLDVAKGDPLAQVYGTYAKGLRDPRLGLDGSEALSAECGFQSSAVAMGAERSSMEATEEYAALTTAWRNLLNARAAARGSSPRRAKSVRPKVVRRAKRRKVQKV